MTRRAWIRASSAVLALAALGLGTVTSLGPPARAQEQCSCPGFEAAPPPPNTPGWEHIEANVTAALNDRLYVQADVHALVTNEDGDASFQGGFLSVTNRGRCPFWFGLSGVLNVGVMPGERQIIPLAHYRRPDDRSPTRVHISGVHCTARAARPDAGTPDAGTASSSQALPGRYMCGVQICCVPGTLAAAGQCTCPLNAVFRPEPGNPLLGRCTCVSNSTWDADRLQCVHQYCPAGMVYRDEAGGGRCECAAGLRWDSASRACVRDTCTGGAFFSAAQNQCACPDGQAWSPSTRRCFDPGCRGGTVFDGRAERCVCPSSAPRWDAAASRCAACPGNRAWTGAECACPAELPRWSEAARRCEACPDGASWNGSDCACDSATPRWTGRRCEACPADRTWDASRAACVEGPVCDPPCSGSQACVAGVCVGSGRLRITLTWDRPGDMDLHVVTPSGDSIYYANRRAAGGQLDRDDTRGTGPENVYWDADPPAGPYTICVNPYSISSATSFDVIVSVGGRVQRLSGARDRGQRESGCSAGSVTYVGTIDVP